jgi:hypothetical protein
MFKDATKIQYDYLSWIKFIVRKYDSTEIEKGGATFFFVNEEGWAVTCKHVIDNIIGADQLNQNYEVFKTALAKEPKKKYQLEKQFKMNKDNPCQAAYQINVNLKQNSQVQFFAHPTVDVALIHFDVLEPTNYCYFVDIMNEIDQGTSLARIGFPFVEFNNYIFDNSRKTLNFTTNNEPMTTFVNDAVVSQNYGDYNNGVFSRTHLILSSPGIKGQSGGPVYDNQGRVAGIQSATATRELDFIGKTKVKNKLVETPQFLNIGICVSAEVIKEFLIQHNVKYYVK